MVVIVNLTPSTVFLTSFIMALTNIVMYDKEEPLIGAEVKPELSWSRKHSCYFGLIPSTLSLGLEVTASL